MDIREKVFNNRSYTPLPLFIALLVLAQPSGWSLLVGLGFCVLGEVIRIWAVRYAGGATRTTSGVGGDVLVTDGPYAHLRNPLYLGNLMNLVGVCVAAWAWMPWMLVLALLLFAIQYGMIISLEEDYLRSRFGEEYRAYAKAVPRVLPRLSPWPERRQIQPESLRRALRTERSTLATMALLLLLIVLRWKVL